MNRKVLLAVSLAVVAPVVAPVVAMGGPIEDQIRFRQSAYSFISWNTGKIKKQVVDQPATYNKEQVIAALARSKGPQYPPVVPGEIFPQLRPRWRWEVAAWKKIRQRMLQVVRGRTRVLGGARHN